MGVLPLMGCATTQDLSEAGSATTDLPESWDYEVDVVVVGSGSILPAALRAHDSGLETLIIEKHPTHFDGTYSGTLGHGMPTLQKLAEQGEPIPDYVAQYDSLEALAESEGIDKENFLYTVNRYNGFIPGFIAANHIATLEPWEAKAE